MGNMRTRFGMTGLYEMQILALIARLLSPNDTTDNKSNPSQFTGDYLKLPFTTLRTTDKRKIFNIKSVNIIYTKINILLKALLTIQYISRSHFQKNFL